ncbi:MAG: amidase, partial [Flavobacteriaceae bacterium]|nr:amidase [Flavobacteriaceae bacterium]
PSSQNSSVGLKPTIGLVSRSGIVPISSTLDTAGPITKSVIDNGIVLDAIFGYDETDEKSINTKLGKGFYWNNFPSQNSLEGKRFAAFNRLKEDTLYIKAIENLKTLGAEVIEIDEAEMNLPDFIRLLNLDMKQDLPAYFQNYGNKNLGLTSVQDVVDFNNQDSLNRSPYGQKLFKGIVADSASEEEFTKIKNTLHKNGKAYFDIAFETHQLDGFLSINNYHAGFAAVAEYPAITVPMGYKDNVAPRGLTFISKPFGEKQLLEWAFVFEQETQSRISPKDYN